MTAESGQEEGSAPKKSSPLVNLLVMTFAPESASTRAEEELKKYLEAIPLSLSEESLHWLRLNTKYASLLLVLQQR